MGLPLTSMLGAQLPLEHSVPTVQRQRFPAFAWQTPVPFLSRVQQGEVARHSEFVVHARAQERFPRPSLKHVLPVAQQEAPQGNVGQAAAPPAPAEPEAPAPPPEPARPDEPPVALLPPGPPLPPA